MKKIIPIIFALSFSTLSFASTTETSSFRTASNQTVALGDSVTELMNRTGQSPNSMKTTSWQEGSTTLNATQYEYNIGENIYSITVVHDQIRKIEYRKNI